MVSGAVRAVSSGVSRGPSRGYLAGLMNSREGGHLTENHEHELNVVVHA